MGRGGHTVGSGGRCCRLSWGASERAEGGDGFEGPMDHPSGDVPRHAIAQEGGVSRM